jgi:hypothetical protein
VQHFLLLLIHSRNIRHAPTAFLWSLVDILDLLDNMVCVVVGQSVLTHKFLDETQLIGALVIDECVFLLATQDLLQVAFRTDSAFMLCLLGFYLSSFAAAAREDGLLPSLGTLAFETDGR